MLDEIVAHKRLELQKSNKLRKLLSPRNAAVLVPGFSEILNKPEISLIAEIKYRSPSHGLFKCRLSPEEIAESYVSNGASALSILTDETFFSGSLDYLARVREYLLEQPDLPSVPLLRKDFIIDRFQVEEAKANGASAFLLIVACLDSSLLRQLIDCGEEQGIEALVEVHDPCELDIALESGAGIIGVNNRNLKTFEVDIRTSFELARRLEGEEILLVAESGLSEPQQILELHDAGFHGFLIGTTFMDTDHPGERLAGLIAGM